jgi:hypothetical protein
LKKKSAKPKKPKGKENEESGAKPKKPNGKENVESGAKSKGKNVMWKKKDSQGKSWS